MRDLALEQNLAETVYITFNNIEIHRANADTDSGWISTHVNAVNISLLEILMTSRARTKLTPVANTTP